MNNLLYILLMLVSTFVSYKGWTALYVDFQNWQATRHKHPHRVKQDRLCTSNGFTHNWISIRWLDGKELTEVQACEDCGYIPSKNCMMPEKSLPGLGIWHRERQFINKARDEFVDEENNIVQELAKKIEKNPSHENIAAFFTRALQTHDRMTEHAAAKRKEFYELEAKRGN